MVNHPTRNLPRPHDERMRALGIPCNSTTRVLWLRAHMMGLTFAARDYPGKPEGRHYMFALFRGTEDRPFGTVGAIGFAVHQDGLRAWLDGFQAAGWPDDTVLMTADRLALKAAGYRLSYTDYLHPVEKRYEVDHGKRTVKISLAANKSTVWLAEAIVHVRRQVEEFADA